MKKVKDIKSTFKFVKKQYLFFYNKSNLDILNHSTEKNKKSIELSNFVPSYLKTNLSFTKQ